jgi:uncharacterized membrane protein YcaP (DUF421 family)
MDSVLRGLFIYLFLFVVFRIAGKRTLAETTNFELVLLLIISETTQQAMIDQDHSMTNGCLLILTLVGTSILLSVIRQKFPKSEKIMEEEPLIILENGKPFKDRLEKSRVDEHDILSAARRLRGLNRLEDIRLAVLESNGEITIIPKERAAA